MSESENVLSSLSSEEVVIPDTLGTQIEGEPTSAEPEAGVHPEPGTPEAEAGKEGQQSLAESKEDGRIIPKWMRALKESDPESYKKAKTDLFDLNQRRSIHPNVQQAREEHDLLESIGGANGIQELRDDAQFFHDAANQFLKGDPAFVADLWEEDKIAAALHVTPMLDNYSKHDPDGYKQTVARLWHKEMETVGFVQNGLNGLEQAIKEKNMDAATAILKSIRDWQESVYKIATKADDPRVKTLLAERAQQRDRAEQESQEAFLKDYKTEAMNTVTDEGAKVFDSFFKGRKIDKEDREDLLREAFALANRKVVADEAFVKQRDAHLAKKDVKSALRLTRARYAREMPDAVKRVARRYGMVSGTTQKQPSPANPGQQPRNAGADGYAPINYRPQPEDIDRSRTTADDIISKRATLNNGKKVTWAGIK